MSEVYFAIADPAGRILRVGSCPDSMLIAQKQPGEFLAVHYKMPDALRDKVDLKTGDVLENVITPPPPAYDELRRREYQPVGDQLDDLWHAMDTGLLPKVPAFYDPIKVLKTKYPKEAK